MHLLEMSDSEIRHVAEPILQDIIRGSNQKNWALFSKHMAREYATPEAKLAIETQWKENEYLTALSEDCEFLGIIRKTNNVLVLWKQTSPKNDNEFLEKLYLQEINGEIKQIGTWLE